MVATFDILRVEGYFERFYWHLQNGIKYHKDAYHKVENELREIGAPPRYTDYGSFRKNKSYHLKKKGRI